MKRERHFGLDVVRTLAISIVFIGHSSTISNSISFSVPDFIKNLSIPDGVDLFFVLSGFLIGRILLHINLESFKNLLHFWKRRWLRTLPNYFLFLLINLLLLWLSISPGLLSHAVLYYFVFLQNLYKPVDVFFWESWSLCVEEWFYLLFPLALFLAYKLKRNMKTSFIIGILGFFIFSLCSKFYFQSLNPPSEFDLYQRILVVNRFDVLCFGLLLALIELNHADTIHKLKLPGLLVFLASVVFVKINQQQYPALYFIISGITCASVLVFFYSFNKGGKLATWLFETLSKISYSIYLIHLPVLYCFNYITNKNYNQYAFLYLCAYTILVIILSWVNYRYFESYFLRKRDA